MHVCARCINAHVHVRTFSFRFHIQKHLILEQIYIWGGNNFGNHAYAVLPVRMKYYVVLYYVDTHPFIY